MSSDDGFAQPWEEFKKEFGEAPLLYGPLDKIFQGWDELLTKMVAKFEFPGPDTSVTTQDVTAGDVACRIYTPANATGHDRLGVYYHGGGWAMGDLNIEDATCRAISKGCNLVIVSVDYRLAPQHRYPAALDDCVDAAKWAIKNRATLKVDDGPVALIGTSAGGNLAFSTALKLIDDGLVDQLAGVVALVPVTVHPDAVPTDMKDQYRSYEEHADDTINTRSAMMAFLEAYGAPPYDKYAFCLLHPRLKDIPRVYMAECGMDTLRDDARLMKTKLNNLNVPVQYDTYPGYPHYSWTFPSAKLQGHQQEFYKNTNAGVAWVFSGTHSTGEVTGSPRTGRGT